MYQANIYKEYTEHEKYGNGYRTTYLNGVKKLVEQKQKESLKEREKCTKRILQNKEESRKEYINMLGWPLNEEKKPILSITKNKIFENDFAIYYRMQFELFKGYKFYGILFQHKSEKPLPLTIVQHGGQGTPEMCSSFFDCENYNDMTMRIFDRGVNVFAPQLLLWGSDRFGPDRQRDDMAISLMQVGGSIAALEIYSISSCIDYFKEQSYCNGLFGMVGLSYGGFYTLYTAAVDTRIKVALACSHFNDRIKYQGMDRIWFNSASNFLDAQVAMLISPRFLRIEVGDNDELFDASSAEKEFKTVKLNYKPKGNVYFNVFKGVHEFCPEDDGLDWFIEKLLN